MSESDGVKIGKLETSVEFMRKEMDELKEKVECVRTGLEDVRSTVKAWGVGIVVAITIVELVLKFYLR